MIRHIRLFSRALRLFSAIKPEATSVNVQNLTQLHPLLIQRAKLLQDEHKQLGTQLESYNLEIQTKYDRLSHILDKYTKSNQLISEIEELSSIKDPELYKDAQAELKCLIPRYEKIIAELKNRLLPPMKYSDKGCIIEMRPGVGGGEASLFTDDLMHMYINFCLHRNWKFQVVSRNTNSSGFLNEAILRIDEPGSFDILRHESGVHRVQRIPETESKGRIHTSTAAVVILPKISDGNEQSLKQDEMQFAPGEVRIDTMRSSGKGGQHVNTTDSAVRLVHIPTGITVMQQDERSQPQNKAKAFAILRSRLAERERIEELERQKSLRQSQVSTTDRSDKIRTYNYPQNRITDHRCGYSLHDIDGCMKGGKLMDLIEKVKEVEYNERLQDMLENSTSTLSTSSPLSSRAR